MKNVGGPYSKWIYSYMEFPFFIEKNIDKETEVKNVLDFAEDLWNIVTNTYSLFSTDGTPIGYSNSYLYPELAPTLFPKYENGKVKNMPSLQLSGTPKTIQSIGLLSYYAVAISYSDENLYYLIIVPIRADVPLSDNHYKADLYSFESFSREGYPLAGAHNLICEKYDLSLNPGVNYYAVMEEQMPCIEMHEFFTKTIYRVVDRLYYSKINPRLENYFLGEKCSVNIEKLLKKLLQAKPNNENEVIWQKEVRKLMNYSKEDLKQCREEKQLFFYINEEAILIDPVKGGIEED